MKLFTNTNLIVYLFALLTGWMNAFGQLTFANDDFVNVSEDVSVRANVLHNDDGDETIFDLSSFRILKQAQFGIATIDTPWSSIPQA
ncbi:MAG: hypothetical protein IPL46_34415 [Saprospiraceae bacterium]|nr:hypothetical protein [Saprospiraceae bacterium]